MSQRIYKKMAGTSAVFITSNFNAPSPVERDGLTWTESELHMPKARECLHWKPPMESALALEGLEEYDPPSAGDARYVNKLGIALVYIEKSKAWVALTDYA